MVFVMNTILVMDRFVGEEVATKMVRHHHDVFIRLVENFSAWKCGVRKTDVASFGGIASIFTGVEVVARPCGAFLGIRFMEATAGYGGSATE